MANKTIGQIPTSATTLTATDLIEVEQGGGTKQAAIGLILSGTYAKISDHKSNTTAGGTLSAGDNTRDLNTEDYDPNGIVSISSNRFTLQAGTYIIKVRAPAFEVGRHKARLYNFTDTANVSGGLGSNAYSAGGGWAHTDSIITTPPFAIASAKAFEIKHYVQNTASGSGGGAHVSSGDDEIYTEVEIWKVA